jgi:hypothetical protein
MDKLMTASFKKILTMPGKEEKELRMKLRRAKSVPEVAFLALSFLTPNLSRAQVAAVPSGTITNPAGRVSLNRAPVTLSWTVRLKYGVLAGMAGWLAGWLMTFPFVLRHAWRYVDAHASQMPVAVAKGMVVWGAFSLFMATVGFVPLVLLFLLISPRWIVRRRSSLLLGVTLAASLAFYYSMGLLHFYHFRHSQIILDFFFTAPHFFSIIFALVMMWVYVVLARRRLSAKDPRWTWER